MAHIHSYLSMDNSPSNFEASEFFFGDSWSRHFAYLEFGHRTRPCVQRFAHPFEDWGFCRTECFSAAQNFCAFLHVHFTFLVHVIHEVAARLKNASKLIRDWSKNNGNKPLPAHWTLTRGKLGLKTGKYCHLHGKGWHTTVVLQWLLDFTDSLPNLPPVLKSALWSANTCLTILHESRKHSTLLTREVIEQCIHVGMFFQKCYLRLHLQYKGFCPYLLFNIRPKFHLLTHFFLTCEKERNPLCSSTWMDETWIGQIMRLAGKCHKRTVQLTALQRYCAGPCSAS